LDLLLLPFLPNWNFCLNLHFSSLDISKPTNARKCIKVYYTHHTPPTCFGHSCGHPQGGALQRIAASKYYSF
jgi:hypothetical protein